MSMPHEIIGLDREKVTFMWDDESKTEIGARALRLLCTCAHCKSEITGERTLDESNIPDTVTVKAMNLVGNYGVNVHFSDGHTTGIYRFKHLKSLDKLS